MSYAVFVEGDLSPDQLDDLGPKIAQAAQRAINSVAIKGRTQAAKLIGQQVNLPASYLTPSSGNLTVTKQATNGDPSATISGRSRPTSLARFAISGVMDDGRGSAGVQVAVKAGSAKFLPRAFLINLRGGADGSNVGLAIRTAGGPPNAAYKPKQIGPNLYLIYGPAVGQVFQGEDGADRGVRDQIAPDLLSQLESEFDRLLELDIR